MNATKREVDDNWVQKLPSVVKFDSCWCTNCVFDDLKIDTSHQMNWTYNTIQPMGFTQMHVIRWLSSSSIFFYVFHPYLILRKGISFDNFLKTEKYFGCVQNRHNCWVHRLSYSQVGSTPKCCSHTNGTPNFILGSHFTKSFIYAESCSSWEVYFFVPNNF